MDDVEDILKKVNIEEFDVPQKVQYKIRCTLKNKHKINNHYTHQILIAIVSIITTLFIGTLGVYATISILNFKQQYTQKDYIKGVSPQFYKHMETYSDGLYYKKINSYEEYVEETKLWSNLIEMNEKDFEESFVIMIAGDSYKTTNLYISNVYIEDDYTCIELKRKDKFTKDANIISAKITRKLEKKNIKIKNLPNIVQTTGQYIELNEITMDYTIEKALEEKCFVIENNIIISSDKSQLDDFIEKKENGILRIYDKGKTYFKISDIQYNDGVININTRACNLIENVIDPIIFATGDKIEKKGFFKNQYTDYVFSDEIGNEIIVCTIKK